MIDINDPQTWIAGREMDTAIALLMGHKLCLSCRYPNQGIRSETGFICCHTKPHYSTTYEGMGLMLEWIAEKELNVATLRVEKYIEGQCGPECEIEYGIDARNIPLWIEEKGRTLPEAVARAILAWHAAQQEGERG